jgi:hypothetical protein
MLLSAERLRLVSSQSATLAMPTAGEIWDAFVRVLRRDGGHWKLVHRIGTPAFWGSQDIAAQRLRRIEAELGKFAQDCQHDSAQLLSIPATSPDGFDIEVLVDSSGVRACFGGLEQDFATVATAMHWVRRALSKAYQLRVSSIGGVACEWSLEAVNSDGGAGDSLASGHLTLFSAFRTKSLAHRRNSLFSNGNI